MTNPPDNVIDIVLAYIDLGLQRIQIELAVGNLVRSLVDVTQLPQHIQRWHKGLVIVVVFVEKELHVVHQKLYDSIEMANLDDAPPHS